MTQFINLPLVIALSIVATFCPVLLLSTCRSLTNSKESAIGPALTSWLLSLSHGHNIVSLWLFYRYFHDNCSDVFFSLVPGLHGFEHGTGLAVGSHSTVEIARFNCKFCSNSLPASCFPLSYENLNTTSIVVFCHFKSCALLFSPLHNIFSVYYTLGNLCKALMNAGGHAS